MLFRKIVSFPLSSMLFDYDMDIIQLDFRWRLSDMFKNDFRIIKWIEKKVTEQTKIKKKPAIFSHIFWTWNLHRKGPLTWVFNFTKDFVFFFLSLSFPVIRVNPLSVLNCKILVYEYGIKIRQQKQKKSSQYFNVLYVIRYIQKDI